jgi:hypothetical protein
MLLRRNGNKLELYDNNALVQSQNLNGLTAVQITGASGEDDRLTVDFNVGGFFSVRDGISFLNAPAVAGTDTLVINATTGADTINIATGRVTVDGSVILFTGAEQLQVNALDGADTVTMTGTNATTATTVNAGTDAAIDSFALSITGSDFVGNLTVLHFEHVTGQVKKGSGGQGGNFGEQNLIGYWMVGGSGTIDSLTVDGSLTSGSTVMTGDITSITVMGDVNGTVAAKGSGSIGDMEVGGSIGSTGTVMTEDITSIKVTGAINGTVEANGSGTIDNLQAGSIGGTGTVMSEDITSIMVTGATEGLISALDIGTISVIGGVAASPVLKIMEGGVLRELVATRAVDGQPATGVVFNYVYEGLKNKPIPQLTVTVTNNSGARFDLSLTTNTAAKFNLAKLTAVGASNIRDVAIEGDLLPGGIYLPGESLGCVAAQGNVVAGTVQAGSVQAVAFGSITQGSVTTLAEAATHVDAAGLLSSGTSAVLANGTFFVPFAEGRPVALFLDTGPGTFDVKDVLFTDQTTDNLSVTAVVTAVSGGITSIQLLGNGGAIQTALAVAGPITSTGPLGDLALSSSSGIGNVTAPSIFGNIDTNGPIWGTIQTTIGDLGRLLANGTGTTTINTSQGITGRIISRGNLVSFISSQKAFSGVIAAQGDIGAYVNGVRLGGFLSNGQFTGQVVALGTIQGDIQAKNGLAGQIAAASIRGSVLVSGNVESTGAVVSKGVIGDATRGTVFSSGAIKGILAAENGINFGGTGNTTAAHIYNPATGPNKAAIDAIFTKNNAPLAFDLMGLDLAGLGLILTDLAALNVGSDGNLTGPVP